MTESKASLYAKKAMVMGLISGVKESGKHSQGWTYSTSEDVKNPVRAAMAKANLSLSFEVIEHTVERSDNRVVVNAIMSYTLECGDTGVTETKSFPAEAIDYGRNMSAEKTYYKLYTASEKYFLKTTFLIASSDELDSDATSPPQTTNVQTEPDNRPWQERLPTKDTFFKNATEYYNVEILDVIDQLKASGFDGYEPAKAPAMWEALKAEPNGNATAAESDHQPELFDGPLVEPPVSNVSYYAGDE